MKDWIFGRKLMEEQPGNGGEGGGGGGAGGGGVGKLITSVTMTVFYVLLYYVWRSRYQISGKKGLTAAVWALALLRVIWYSLTSTPRPIR